MGTEPAARLDDRSETAGYCREIETYLCRKNDGHLIRVTGPSFDLVAGWAGRGIPLKVALAGIDRYFERYYRTGPRRRPVKIDFCDADVLDVFNEWRRATGVVGPGEPPSGRSRNRSLPDHLERVVMRLTAARAKGSIGEAFDDLLDRVARDLDVVRGEPKAVRGTLRQQMIDRLAAIDGELLARARGCFEEAARVELMKEAVEDLAPFRASMPADAFERARTAAFDRLVRERLDLPFVKFEI